MKAIFYDRKNKCNVSNDKLMKITYQVDLTANSGIHDDPRCEGPFFCYTMDIGTLGYKSPECPDYKNWDLSTSEEHLVFLYFEED